MSTPREHPMSRSRADEEFCEFFAARGPALRRVAFLVVGDWPTAEDVTQAAMSNLYVAWRRVRPESVEAYARKVVVNEAISTLRRRRDVLVAEPAEVADDRPVTGAGHHPVLGDGREDEVARALAALPPQQRAVVALRFLDDQSVADTARVLGVTTGTVKSQTSRALGTLRRHLPALALSEETR